METSLDRLAEWVGIEAEYKDALEVVQRTSPETKRALLRVMGLRAEDESQAAASLAELEQAAWARALPTCAVLYADRPLEVAVTLPRGTASVPWRLTLEDGQERTGRTSFAALAVVATREDRERRLLVLPEGLPWGYHALRLEGVDEVGVVIVTPGRCWLPGEDESEGQSVEGAQAASS